MTEAPAGRRPDAAAPEGVRLRPATAADLPACAGIWRDALNDYMGRLNLPEVPLELGGIRRLHDHLLATDPDRFWIASGASAEAGHEEPFAFGAATRRDDVWFLSMLFVEPSVQRRGVGRAILERLLPSDGATLATGTDSAQPISNALYARFGIVPRLPLFPVVGRPHGADAFEPLPSGVRGVPFETVAAGPPDGPGHRRLVAAVDELDRTVAGFSHPQDHRFVRTEGRRGFLYVGPDDDPVGYGYASEAGRVGPIAVRDPSLLPAVLGHLLDAVQPRGASALWVPGASDVALSALLRAGLRLDGFPMLLCWSRPFADFERYLPISPGLL